MESKFQNLTRFEIMTNDGERVEAFGNAISVLENDLCIFRGSYAVAEVIGFKWWKAEDIT